MKRLTNLDVSELLIKHNIKSDTALFAKAHEQKEAGKKDLAHFLMSRSSKGIARCYSKHMENAHLIRKVKSTTSLSP